MRANWIWGVRRFQGQAGNHNENYHSRYQLEMTRDVIQGLHLDLQSHFACECGIIELYLIVDSLKELMVPFTNAESVVAFHTWGLVCYASHLQNILPLVGVELATLLKKNLSRTPTFFVIYMKLNAFQTYFKISPYRNIAALNFESLVTKWRTVRCPVSWGLYRLCG